MISHPPISKRSNAVGGINPGDCAHDPLQRGAGRDDQMDRGVGRCRAPLLGWPANQPWLAGADARSGNGAGDLLHAGNATADDAGSGPDRPKWRTARSKPVPPSRCGRDRRIPSSMRVPFRAFALFGALISCTALWASPAAAQIQLFPTCSVTGDATAPASITYDPFSSTGFRKPPSPWSSPATAAF